MQLLCVIVFLSILYYCHAQSTGQGATSIPGAQFQARPTTPDCSNGLFQRAVSTSNLSPNALDTTTGAQLLYIARDQLCDAKMDCGASGKQMTLSIALATSGQGIAQGTCTKFVVSQVPPFSSACEQVFQAPENQLSNTLNIPLYVGLTTTRAMVYYPLVAVKKINTIAYTYAQFSDDTSAPDFACSTTIDTCDQATKQTYQTKGMCTPKFIDDTWGDSQYDPVVMEHCGANADFPQDIFATEKRSCGQCCCTPCGTETNRAIYRRWPFGPQCKVYSVGAPQLRVYGGLVVSFNSDLSDGEEVRFQTPVTLQNGQTTYTGGLQSNLNFLSASRKIRVHVNQRAQAPDSLEKIDGYVVVCSSSVQDTVHPTCDMGASNPYVQSPIPSPCLTQYSPEMANSVPPVAPPNASPDQLRTGTVPTSTSLNNNAWPCTWYYIPTNQSQSVIESPNAEVFATMAKESLAYALWPNLIADFGTNTKCPGNDGGDTYFEKFVGVPGWELDPDTLQPRTTSVCQMNHAMNTYAQLYDSYYSASHDADEAMQQAAPAPIWLLPEYSIARPNWWLHDGGLMFDLGLTYPQRTGLELLVQLAEDTYVPLEITNDEFALKLPESSCAVVVGNGTGSIQLAVQGLFSGASTLVVSQYMQVNCTTTRNENVTLKYSNGTHVNNTTNIVPFEALQSGVVLVHILSMNFTNQTVYVVNDGPFVSCTVQLLNNQLVPYGDLTTLSCRTTLGNASLAVEYGEATDLSGSRLALYIGLGVVGGILLLLAAIVLILWIAKCFRKDGDDYSAMGVGEDEEDE